MIIHNFAVYYELVVSSFFSLLICIVLLYSLAIQPFKATSVV